MSCSCRSIGVFIILPFIATPSIISRLSLNVEYGYISCATLSRLSKTELWLSIDKLSSITMDLSGLKATQGAATCIVTRDYAVHSLLEWLL